MPNQNVKRLTLKLKRISTLCISGCVIAFASLSMVNVQAAPPNATPIAIEDLESLTPAQRGIVDRFGDQLQQTRDALGEQATGLVEKAMSLIGVPYRYGGNSPATGLDCSGFVRWVYENSLGKVLPRRAVDQAMSAAVIERNELKPGDLVFFNTMRRAFSHVGIYLGDGKFIHAPSTGGKVRVENLEGYWGQRFTGARRVVSEAELSGLSGNGKPNN